MNILITGSTGFVGTALLHKINKSNSNDKVYLLSSRDNESYETYLYHREGVNYSFKVPKNIDVLIHLGAWIPKSTAVANDVEKSFSNIQFTHQLLGSFKGLKKVIFVSSIDVYAPTTAPINEESIVKPISLYGSSKVYCEEMVKAWANEKTIPCCILRLGHIYGVGEYEYKKLIPIFIGQALRNEPINIFSDGQEKRSFLDVENCAEVIWKSAHDESTGIYNVASGNPVSVLDVAKIIKSLAKSESEIKVLNKVTNTRDCVFDNKKLKDQFQIVEKPLEEGIKEEIEYFKNLN